MLMRIALLFSLSWILRLTAPLFTIWQAVSGRDLILILGGLFLIAKSTYEIHHKLEGEEGHASARVKASMASVLVQIILLDIVFSLDSVITAVGMTNRLGIMITAVIVAVLFMMVFAGAISAFVNRHPTVKILALSFLLLIGTTLIIEGLHQHISKGYIYFAMAFSVFVEMLNLRLRGSRACRCTCTSRTLRKGRNSTRNHAYKRICQGENMDITRAAVVDYIMNLFGQRGSADYGGERVTQRAHALQTAWQAEQQGSSRAMIVAALLHDIGHLLHDLTPGYAVRGLDDRHETLGARWLSPYFGPQVRLPIQLHVAAKRYLCATEAPYFATLSPGSVRSLELQGGPFTSEQAQRFAAKPYAQDAIVLRRWDEQAKVCGLQTPPLEHFRPHLEAVLLP